MEFPLGYGFKIEAKDIERILLHMLCTGGRDAADVPQCGDIPCTEIYSFHPQKLVAADGCGRWFFSSVAPKSRVRLGSKHQRAAPGGRWRCTSNVRDIHTMAGCKIGELRKLEFLAKKDEEWIKTEFLATEYRAWFSEGVLSKMALYLIYRTPRKAKLSRSSSSAAALIIHSGASSQEETPPPMPIQCGLHARLPERRGYSVTSSSGLDISDFIDVDECKDENHWLWSEEEYWASADRFLRYLPPDDFITRVEMDIVNPLICNNGLMLGDDEPSTPPVQSSSQSYASTSSFHGISEKSLYRPSR